MRVNVDGTRAILEHARRHRVPPVLVFSSSLAVFGEDPALPAETGGPAAMIGDDSLPRPQSSYGIPKLRK
jgi:nucleoside-diphosphate-sugar epimerase